MMRYRLLGSSGLRVSELCLGTMTFGEEWQFGASLEVSRAIFDANVTNVIAAALMFWFGSGPIKGFAVVLTIGIVTSVFTAVTVTRMFVAHWLRTKRPTSINI